MNPRPLTLEEQLPEPLEACQLLCRACRNRLLYQRQERPWFLRHFYWCRRCGRRYAAWDRLDAWTSSSPLSPTDAPENAVQRWSPLSPERKPRTKACTVGVSIRVKMFLPAAPWQILPAAASSGKGALTRAVTVLTYFGIASSPSRSDSGNAGPPESSKHADRPRSKTTIAGYTVRSFMVV